MTWTEQIFGPGSGMSAEACLLLLANTRALHVEQPKCVLRAKALVCLESWSCQRRRALHGLSVADTSWYCTGCHFALRLGRFRS